jgi:hypothetical protein
MKRRKVNLFSLSFLDCICCGLGAVILLFVLVNARGAIRRDRVTRDLQAQVDRLEEEVLEGRKHMIQARNVLDETRQELVKTRGASRRVIEITRKSKTELAEYDKETLATRADANRLKADLKSLEEEVKRLRAGARKQAEQGERLRPFPGTGDRQYLTDLKVGGSHLLILVDASASMLDQSIVEIIRRRYLKAAQKIKSPKWRRVVATVDWLTTQLPSQSRFQVMAFNETAFALVKPKNGDWLDAGSVDQLDQAVARMRKLVPEKGTSLINAFTAAMAMKPRPDNIFLLTDGLPTMGASKPWRKRVSASRRLKHFYTAMAFLPREVPVNVILFPLEGDPDAAGAFWRLAWRTHGALLCPSKDWP